MLQLDVFKALHSYTHCDIKDRRNNIYTQCILSTVSNCFCLTIVTPVKSYFLCTFYNAM